MVPSYNLNKIHNEIKYQIPKPFNSLYDFYKKVLPSVIRLAYNNNQYYKIDIEKVNKI